MQLSSLAAVGVYSYIGFKFILAYKCYTVGGFSYSLLHMIY